MHNIETLDKFYLRHLQPPEMGEKHKRLAEPALHAPNEVFRKIAGTTANDLSKAAAVLAYNLESRLQRKSSRSESHTILAHHPAILRPICMQERGKEEARHQIIYQACPYSLENFLRFTATSSSSLLQKLFLCFQLIHVVGFCHLQGIIHDNLSPANIFLEADLWLKIGGFSFNTLHRKERRDLITPDSPPPAIQSSTSDIANEQQFFAKASSTGESLRVSWKHADGFGGSLPSLWKRGLVSNFDYLMVINQLAGRRLKDPNLHPILPWVIDFQSERGHWRDLKKSKFRLSKGDLHLDLIFQSKPHHHVPEWLSELSYFNYLARVTPIPLLTKHVRAAFNPLHYAQSIQRLYDLTPDECIPEFYTDATVFHSIHPEMSDLGAPSWASSPEQFVQIHRELLESTKVSHELHHWIDLTFGYKLLTPYSIDEKNVPLQTKKPTNCGIAALFSHPHPSKQQPTSLISSVRSSLDPKISLQLDLSSAVSFEIVRNPLAFLLSFKVV